MPPSRGSSGPPRRDYGGGSNNGNSFNPYISGALSAKNNIILFYVSLVRNLHKYVSLNFNFFTGGGFYGGGNYGGSYSGGNSASNGNSKSPDWWSQS